MRPPQKSSEKNAPEKLERAKLQMKSLNASLYNRTCKDALTVFDCVRFSAWALTLPVYSPHS